MLSVRTLLLVEARKHIFDGLVVVVEGLRLYRSRLCGHVGLLELTIPGTLDAGNGLAAEMEPALHVATLLNGVLVVAAIHVVEGSFRMLAQLESNLDDLAQVHTRGELAGGVVEVGVSLELLANEVLHRLQVLVIVGLSDQVKD